MKPEALDPVMQALPDEELISPIEPPSEANDGPDADALEDRDAPEDDADRAGEL
jgi:hypothetical protein